MTPPQKLSDWNLMRDPPKTEISWTTTETRGDNERSLLL